mmetsp:Transcript_73459/g.115860  ORF Transcript_73459/g.115860 Transcript_73459/m.115860 type:complete len:231 (+) Transcript_73459:525-1217(+)
MSTILQSYCSLVAINYSAIAEDGIIRLSVRSPTRSKYLHINFVRHPTSRAMLRVSLEPLASIHRRSFDSLVVRCMRLSSRTSRNYQFLEIKGAIGLCQYWLPRCRYNLEWQDNAEILSLAHSSTWLGVGIFRISCFHLRGPLVNGLCNISFEAWLARVALACQSYYGYGCLSIPVCWRLHCFHMEALRYSCGESYFEYLVVPICLVDRLGNRIFRGSPISCWAPLLATSL